MNGFPVRLLQQKGAIWIKCKKHSKMHSPTNPTRRAGRSRMVPLEQLEQRMERASTWFNCSKGTILDLPALLVGFIGKCILECLLCLIQIAPFCYNNLTGNPFIQCIHHRIEMAVNRSVQAGLVIDPIPWCCPT